MEASKDMLSLLPVLVRWYMEQRGYPIHPEDVARLSPYLTEHLQRFGDYVLKLRQLPSEEDALSPEPLSENGAVEEEMSA